MANGVRKKLVCDGAQIAHSSYVGPRALHTVSQMVRYDRRMVSLRHYKRLITDTSHAKEFSVCCITHEYILEGLWITDPYPRWFLGHVGRTPYRTHSLGDGPKCRRRKGLKTVCLGPTRTSAS